MKHKAKEHTEEEIRKAEEKLQEVIASFIGAREVERQFGYNQGNISACARGEKEKANGYIWKYPL